MTTKPRLIYDNLWRKGTMLTPSSEDPQHPATDTQIDTKSMFWRTTRLDTPDEIPCDLGEFSSAGIGLMNFDSGSVEPQVGEWLFGELAFGKVVSVTLSTGAWGSDATGSIVLERCEGCFNDDENIRGSIGGTNILTVNHPDNSVGADKLVKNGAFVHDVDDPPNDWTPDRSALLTTEGGGKVGNCMMITEDGENDPIAYSDNCTVIPGKIYKVVGYVKAGDEATYRWYIRDISNGVYIYNPGNQEETAGDWSTELSYTFEAPSGCTNVQIWVQQICAQFATTTIYFDEITLYELNEDDTEKKVDFVAILGHKFSSGATIKAIGAWDSGFTEQAEEVVIPYNPDNIFYFFPSAITRRYWEVQISDTSNTDNYIEIAMILCGKYFEPNRNFVVPYSQGIEDYSEIELSDSVVLFGQEKSRLKTWLLPFRGLDDESKVKALALMDECGIHKAFVIVFDSNNPNTDSHLVRLEELVAPENIHFGYWNWEMAIKEIL